VNEGELMDRVEWRDGRALECMDAATLAMEDAKDEVRETVQLIHILDEMTTLEECMLMNRLLMCRKNAAHDVFEILSGALDRSVRAQANDILKAKDHG
jgi:hypothetical protein